MSSPQPSLPALLRGLPASPRTAVGRFRRLPGAFTRGMRQAKHVLVPDADEMRLDVIRAMDGLQDAVMLAPLAVQEAAREVGSLAVGMADGARERLRG